MADKKNKAKKNIKAKLETNYLLRAEMDNPYIEEYINLAIDAILDELFNESERNSKENTANEIMNITRRL